MNTILESTDQLIEEKITQFSTFERIFRYGPFKTFNLALWRFFNAEVLEGFKPLIAAIDEAIEYFKKNTDTNPELYINSTDLDLGEFANKSKLRDKGNTLKALYSNLSFLILAVSKVYMDELSKTNNTAIQRVNSFNSLGSIRSKDKKQQRLFNNIKAEFTNILSDKPTSVLSFSELKRQYIDSKFISGITNKLDSQIQEYVENKMTESTSITVKNVIKKKKK